MNEILFSGIMLEDLVAKIEQVIENKLDKASPKQEKKQPVFLSRSEVAKLLKISLPTLHQWTKLGWLQSYKIGNRVLYKSLEVEQALHKVFNLKHKKNITEL